MLFFILLCLRRLPLCRTLCTEKGKEREVVDVDAIRGKDARDKPWSEERRPRRRSLEQYLIQPSFRHSSMHPTYSISPARTSCHLPANTHHVPSHRRRRKITTAVLFRSS